MHGIFVETLKPGEVKIEGEENRHLKVARIREGEKVFLTDGKGNFCTGILKRQGKNHSIVFCEKIRRAQRERVLYVAIAIIDQPRAEIAVEKGTELGVTGFMFFPSVRSQKRSLRWERLMKRAREAIKQSKNPFLPEIRFFSSLGDAIENVPLVDKRFYLHFGGGKFSTGASGICFVGPEGGWTQEEIEEFKKNRFQKVGLGDTVLRSETAVIAFASLFMLS